MNTDALEGDDSEESGALADVVRGLLGLEPADRWVEVIAAIVLSLATIASAWSAYQATRWGGVQGEAFAEASAFRAESVRASDLADADLTIDTEYFVLWLEGAISDDVEFTAALQKRMRPEFSIAFEAWLETDPLNNPDAPNTPFEMDEYRLAATAEADELRTKAEASAVVAVDANQTADNYVLTTVLFAAVLFLAGISTKFRGRWLKGALLALGFLAFVSGTWLLVTFPIH